MSINQLNTIMKQQACILLSLLLLISLILTSCDKTVGVGPNGTTLNKEDLIKAISKRLNSKCVGYQVVISVNGTQRSIYAYGDARLAQDGNSRVMFVNEKYNIASCSKTITAAALLRALSAKQKTVNDLIYPYLPSHWTLGTGIKTITFKQLLTHQSGFYDKTYGSDIEAQCLVVLATMLKTEGIQVSLAIR